MAAKTGRGEGAGNVSGRKVVNDEFRMTKSERRTKPEARTRTLRRYVYCSLLIVDVGVLFCGCGAETKQGSQAFRHSLRQKDVQVTLLAVERRNVFVDPGASGHFASDPRVVPGLAVAYAVESLDNNVTNEPVVSFPAAIIENGKLRPLPGPKDVPKGFNPWTHRSYRFEEYKQKYFPHFELRTVKTPSNTVVYLSEQYGINITNQVITLAIEALLPGSTSQVFVFKNVPLNDH